MTRRTRLFLAVAAVILVAGLGTGLVASYGGFQSFVTIGRDGPDELSYVPAGAHFVAYANVRDIMDSGARRRLAELQPGSRDGADRFREQTGIDFETDIDYVVAAAFEPAASSTGGQPHVDGPPLAIARGRFDEARIEGLVREHGGSIEDYRGSRLFVHDEKMALVFLEHGLAAIGTPTAVRKAIDTKASGVDIRDNAELMRQIREMDNGDAWVVARFDALSGGRIPAEIAKQIPAISWFAATGSVGDGVEGQIRVEARDEAAAQNLQEVVRGFMALARLQIGQHPELTEVLNTLQLTGQGTSVSLSFSVPSDVVDALGAMHAKRLREPRETPARPEAPAPPAL